MLTFILTFRSSDLQCQKLNIDLYMILKQTIYRRVVEILVTATTK